MEHATATAIDPLARTIEAPTPTQGSHSAGSNSAGANSTGANSAGTQAASFSAPARAAFPSASATSASEHLAASALAAEATEIIVPRFTPRIREALQLLADAAACAQDVGADV